MMPDEQKVANNSQTYVADADSFQFETIEQKNGQATVIRFRLEDPRYHADDVLVAKSGSEIHFHGMIGQLADRSAISERSPRIVIGGDRPVAADSRTPLLVPNPYLRDEERVCF